MMRLLAIALNLALVVTLICLIADSGMPREGKETALMLLFAVTPLVNLGILFSQRGSSKSKGLLALYLERKALEEQKKIADLKR
jgi:hypothetical protein